MSLFRSVMSFARSALGSASATRKAINTAARNVARTPDAYAKGGVPSIGRSITQGIAIATHSDATAVAAAGLVAAGTVGAAALARKKAKKGGW